MKERNAVFYVKTCICIFMLIIYASDVQRFFADSILTLFYLLLMFVIVIMMIPDIYREGKGFKDNPKTLLLIPLGILLIFIFDNLLMENFVEPYLFKAVGITPEDANTERVFEMIRSNPVFMVLMTCFIAPIMEEILYRYTAFGLISKKNIIVAHIITAVLFGLQHVIEAGVYGGDVTQFINIGSYIVYSLIMTNLYSKTKNICIPIVIHILINSFGVMFMLLTYQ